MKLKKKAIIKAFRALGVDTKKVNGTITGQIAEIVASMKNSKIAALDQPVLDVLESLGIVSGFADVEKADKFIWTGKPAATRKKGKKGARPGVLAFVARTLKEAKEPLTLDELTTAAMEMFPERDRQTTYRTIRSQLGNKNHPNSFETRYGVKLKVKGTAGNKRNGIEETRTFAVK